MAEIKVVKISCHSPRTGTSFVFYVAPEFARYSAKLQLEMGYEVTQEELTELPPGASFDIGAKV
jgi:hypothetical protein